MKFLILNIGNQIPELIKIKRTENEICPTENNFFQIYEVKLMGGWRGGKSGLRIAYSRQK